MPDSRPTTVFTEVLPPSEQFRRASAAAAIAEWNMLREVMAHPAWKLVERCWEGQRQRLETQRFQAAKDEPETLRAIQADMDGYDLPKQILAERRERAKSAAEWQKKQAMFRQEAPQQSPWMEESPPPELDVGLAERNITEADSIRDMLAMGGCRLLLRLLAARAWAHFQAIDGRSPEDAQRHFYAAKACVVTLTPLEAKLQLGLKAERSLKEKEQKEKE